MLLRMGGAGGRTRWTRAAGSTPPRPEYVIVSATAPVKPGEGALHLTDMEVNVDPLAEWKQMYHEVWRIERSYFYDPNLHGVNAADGEKEYEKYLDSLASRADLNYIIPRIAERVHRRAICAAAAATFRKRRRVPGGLLGADYEIANGRYRFKKSTPARAGIRSCARRWRSPD